MSQQTEKVSCEKCGDLLPSNELAMCIECGDLFCVCCGDWSHQLCEDCESTKEPEKELIKISVGVPFNDEVAKEIQTRQKLEDAAQVKGQTKLCASLSEPKNCENKDHK